MKSVDSTASDFPAKRQKMLVGGFQAITVTSDLDTPPMCVFVASVPRAGDSILCDSVLYEVEQVTYFETTANGEPVLSPSIHLKRLSDVSEEPATISNDLGK